MRGKLSINIYFLAAEPDLFSRTSHASHSKTCCSVWDVDVAQMTVEYFLFFSDSS